MQSHFRVCENHFCFAQAKFVNASNDLVNIKYEYVAIAFFLIRAISNTYVSHVHHVDGLVLVCFLVC